MCVKFLVCKCLNDLVPCYWFVEAWTKWSSCRRYMLNIFSWMKNEITLIKFHLNISLSVWLTIRQHWFRYHLGVIRQQTIAWSNVGPILWRNMMSLGFRELTESSHFLLCLSNKDKFVTTIIVFIKFRYRRGYWHVQRKITAENIIQYVIIWNEIRSRLDISNGLQNTKSSYVIPQIVKFMGPTWVLSAPDGPHVGPMNLAIRAIRVMIYVRRMELYAERHTMVCMIARVVTWPGPRLTIKTVFPWRSRGHLIFLMGIPILVRPRLYIATPQSVG